MPNLVGAGHSKRRPLWKIVIVLLVILTAPVTIPLIISFVLFGSFLVYEGVSVHSFYARTPFVADLPGPTIQDEQRQFVERAENTFLIGMPVDDLERMLMPQGFSPSPTHRADERRLHVEHGIFPCLMGCDVVWTEQDGKVTTVRGAMTATCL